MANDKNKHTVYVKTALWEPAKAEFGGVGMSKLIQILLTKLNNGETKITMEDLKREGI